MITKIYEFCKRKIKENYKYLLSFIVLVLVFTIELPVAIYIPGGMIDLSKRVEVDKGYKTEGELAMSYVSMLRSSLPYVLLSYVIPNWDLEKKEDVVYEGSSVSETIEIDKLYMQEGINNAIISAYNLAGKTVTVKNEKLKVIYVMEESKSKLKINDEIIAVDDNTVKSTKDISEIVKNKNVGDTVNVKIIRNNKEKVIKSTVSLIDNEKKLGVASINLQQLKTDPEVKIKTKDSESGSSGGLMTSLAIYNSLTKNDITKGKIIAGTGTIDASGDVGEIGGVKYKILGSKKADIFLCPKENYEEAMKVKKENKLNMKIVSVESLKDAVNYLEGL